MSFSQNLEGLFEKLTRPVGSWTEKSWFEFVADSKQLEPQLVELVTELVKELVGQMLAAPAAAPLAVTAAVDAPVVSGE